MDAEITSMDSGGVERALERLGEVLRWPEPVELLLVGGAAGLLTGVLPAERTTADCDVIRYLPADAVLALELAAKTVADELGLDERWLNADVQHIGVLPEGWQSRRIKAAQHGQVYVYAVGRLDLIAMKFYAGRDQDLDDLEALSVAKTDADFVQTYLDALPDREKAQAAQELLDAWELIP